MAVKNTKRIIFVTLISILLINTSHLILKTHSATPHDLSLKVGYYEDYPLIYTDSSNKIQGLYKDILNYIARHEGWTIEWIHSTFSTLLNHLKNGTIDIMTAIAYSKERSEIFDFNNESIISNWGEIYTKTSLGIDSIIDLQDKSIAVVEDDIYYMGENGFLTLVKKFGINCSFIFVDNYKSVLNTIQNGKADAGIVSRLFGDLNADQYKVKKTNIFFMPVELCFAFPKGKEINNYLIHTIDGFLNNMKKDKDSIYYQSLDYYLGSAAKKVFPRWLYIPLGVIFGILLIVFMYVVILRIQVKRKTREIVEKTSLIQMIYESSPDAILLTNLKGEILNCNSATLKLTKTPSKDQIIGKNILSIFVKETNQEAKEFFNNVILKEEKEVGFIHYKLKKSNNSFFPADISYAIVKDNNDPKFIIFIVKDVSVQSMLVDSLEKERGLAEFYSDVLTHDISNINQIIMSHAYLIETYTDNKEIIKNVRGINKAVLKSEWIIEAIKDIRNTEKLKYEAIDLKDCIDKAINKFQQRTNKKLIVTNKPDQSCIIEGNKLVHKAISAVFHSISSFSTENEIKIELDCKRKNKTICQLTIKNHELGLSEEKRNDIINNLQTYKKRTGVSLYYANFVFQLIGANFDIFSNKDGTIVKINFIARTERE